MIFKSHLAQKSQVFRSSLGCSTEAQKSQRMIFADIMRRPRNRSLCFSLFFPYNIMGSECSELEIKSNQIKSNKNNTMDKAILDMNAEEIRAFTRLLIREGKITGLTSSETKSMKKPECLEWIESALGEEAIKASPSSADMSEIRKEIEKALETVSNRVRDVEERVNEALDSPKTVKRLKTISGARSGNPIVAECLKYYKAGELNQTKLMLLSPPSFGKSHAVRELAREYDIFLEHGCSKSIEEEDTLKGCATPDN